MLLTVAEVLRYIPPSEVPPLHLENIGHLVECVNRLGEFYPHPVTVTSGYRTAAANSRLPGAASHSAHMSGEAVDLADPGGDLDQWCLLHPDHLTACGLYQEAPEDTPGWTHITTRAPHSGKRVFRA